MLLYIVHSKMQDLPAIRLTIRCGSGGKICRLQCIGGPQLLYMYLGFGCCWLVDVVIGIKGKKGHTVEECLKHEEMAHEEQQDESKEHGCETEAYLQSDFLKVSC